ncbi:MAG: ATP-binding protein [Xanthomonadaceae bacterium]|nr:ATP-binding protein [Xanthomonadaceae bacterium]
MKEHQNMEWKASWRDDHLRWVCGFANADGGVLVIGRDDQGWVVGIPDARKLLEDLPNKIRDLLGIIVEVNLHAEDGREYLEVVTPAYPSPISYRGHYYQRSGSTLQELKGAALDRFLLRHYGRTWDGAPLPGVAVADLSTAALQRFRQLAARSGRLDEAALQETDAGLLTKLKLTEGKYLKRAAVLLFHPDPLAFVTGAFVKIGYFRTAADLVYHDEINGDLLTQVQQTQELLQTKYLKAAIAYDGLVRVERFPVPGAALREAVLNALVHRDYMVPAPIQIRVYDDRLVLWNPATLPDGWTQETLLGPHQSQPPNPDIANTFFRAGEIEAWGRGIERIFAACREAGTPKPRIRFETGGLWTEFPFAKAYLKQIEGVRVTTTEPVTPEVTPDAAAGRPESQPESLALRAMGLLVEGAMSKAEISAGLGHKEISGQLNRVIRLLLQERHVTYTIPAKPNSRLQKYILTEQGTKRLAELRKGRTSR